MIVHVAEHPSPLGRLRSASCAGRLCALAFAGRPARRDAWLARRFPGATLVAAPSASALAARLDAYFAGALDALAGVDVSLVGTPFQCAVWTALRAIPPGTTLSYAALAARLGTPAAVRAVGAANGANPIPIVVPCHRVVGSDGGLVGYGGGLARKRWLLAHEGIVSP